MDLGIYSPQDYMQRYGECIVQLTDQDQAEHLFWIRDADTTHIGGFVIKNNVWTPANFLLRDVAVDLSVPDCGLVNYKGRVINVTRKCGASRQYKQAFTYSGGLFYTEVLQSTLRNLAWNPQSYDFVQEVFSPKYYGLQAALNLINTKKALSVAITNKYFVSLSNSFPFITLGTEHGVIGKVIPELQGVILFIPAKALEQDLMKYCNVLGVQNDF